MTILGKDVVTYQDKLYYIYRKEKIDRIKSDMVSLLKDFWLCDIVIKGKYQGSDDSYLFLREISDAIIVDP